jgi:hypothetical protein
LGARSPIEHAAGKAIRAICGMGGSGGHCAHGRPWRPEAYPVKLGPRCRRCRLRRSSAARSEQEYRPPAF